MKKVIGVIILSIAVFYSCKDSIVENEDTNVGRINFQEGTMDGVKTGDDTTAVIKLLGKPHWIGLGDFDGFDFNYENKQKPGIEILTIQFLNVKKNQHPGDYRVAYIIVENSYTGKSKEGIGIGTNKVDVLKAIGSPVAIYDFGENYRFTRSDKTINNVLISYDNNQKIERISIAIITN